MRAVQIRRLKTEPVVVDVDDVGGTEILAVALNPLDLAVGRSDLDRIPAEFGDDGFTVCIDPVWGEPLAGALAYAALGARIVHVGQSAGPEAPLRSADVRGKQLTIVGHSNFALSPEERDRAYI